jgi:hypothetical protein
VSLKRFHQLYGLSKLHKVPLAWRPMISCVCGELEAASKWLDYQPRKVANAVPTYLCDSQEAVNSLKEMSALPANSRLFTADAMAGLGGGRCDLCLLSIVFNFTRIAISSACSMPQEEQCSI